MRWPWREGWRLQRGGKDGDLSFKHARSVYLMSDRNLVSLLPRDAVHGERSNDERSIRHVAYVYRPQNIIVYNASNVKAFIGLSNKAMASCSLVYSMAYAPDHAQGTNSRCFAVSKDIDGLAVLPSCPVAHAILFISNMTAHLPPPLALPSAPDGGEKIPLTDPGLPSGPGGENTPCAVFGATPRASANLLCSLGRVRLVATAFT